jgi:hypothetical protein
MFIANPLWSPVSILVVASALSIGWGIRGNYGHELGAMFPGALAAIAVAVLSGREDWRRRVVFFALFGALGWGFGGSISYMQVIGYTHTNHLAPPETPLPSQEAATPAANDSLNAWLQEISYRLTHDSTLYGFLGLFAIGFLWAAVGGGATALPAWLDRQKLVDLVYSFVPLFLLWTIIYFVDIELIQPTAILEKFQKSFATEITAAGEIPPIEATVEPSKMSRHEEPLYWFDSDWLNVTIILVGIMLFNLVMRRGKGIGTLALFAGTGAMAGVGVQYLCQQMGWTQPILDHIVHLQGDPTKFPAEQLAINLPGFIMDSPGQVGWGAGLALGTVLYFLLLGEFAYGSLFYFYLAVGWLVGFLGLTVLGDLHMTPPRGDSWSGITGMLVAGWIYFIRERWTAPLFASIVSGLIGGIGFSGTAWLKLLLVSWGNPNITSDPKVIAAWQHYQSANWHSFLEQTYGFINGIAVVVALALILRRTPELDETGPRRRWSELFALFFVIPVLLYANMVKNLNGLVRPYGGIDGQGTYQPVASTMKLPFLSSVELTAWGWYTLFFAIVTAGFMFVAYWHARRPLAIVPQTWAGRGQFLFFLLCWLFVLGNVVKALPAFTQERLLTEGFIFLHAVVATVLLLVVTPLGDKVMSLAKPRWGLAFAASILLTVMTVAFLPYGMMLHVRHLYGDKPAGHAGKNIRWGEEANWRVSPNLKGIPHR